MSRFLLRESLWKPARPTAPSSAHKPTMAPCLRVCRAGRKHMQLQFTREELIVVAEILESQIALPTGGAKNVCQSLLNRVIDHDLRLASDELEDLQEILNAYGKQLQQQLDQALAAA